MNVYIGKPVVVSDMQWPCDSGFHVPVKSEWVNLGTELFTNLWLAKNWWTLKTYLKLPANWDFEDNQFWNRWNVFYYYSSSNMNARNCRWIYADTNNANFEYWNGKSWAEWIRAFANTVSIPDNTWTTLYDWSGIADWAWIFHNATLGLISISSDWTNWITIADKNVWATTVYNDWDTLSEANTGKYFQWWNNYGFPFTWPTTTSSTRVNASVYWPWNYYSSSTFITWAINNWWDTSNNANLRWWVSQWSTTKDVELQNAYIWEYVPPYLCFTANTAGSTIKLMKYNSPTSVTLETSTDWTNRSAYTFDTDITLSNIWDKVYFRNTSETDTWFNIDSSNYYQFVMSWSIASSWDTTSLLNKNWTDTASENCFFRLFRNCSSLIEPPKLPSTILNAVCYQQMFNGCTNLIKAPELPAINLSRSCYVNMFFWCSNLVQIPKLPAVALADSCYFQMFYNCSKIKLSTTQTWEYQTPYRIPTTWTWSVWDQSLSGMFGNTWWSFVWEPSINTTYYTSNTVV